MLAVDGERNAPLYLDLEQILKRKEKAEMKSLILVILVMVMTVPVVSYGSNGLDNSDKESVSAFQNTRPATSPDDCSLKGKTDLDQGSSRYEFQSLKSNGSLDIVVTSRNYNEAKKVCELESREHKVNQ